MRPVRTACLFVLALAAIPDVGHAHEVCDLPPRHGVSAQAAAIVRSACREHLLWRRPFIDADGRLASLGVTEAERVRLDAGDQPAWQRVAMYWRDSGTLQPMASEGTPGAASCLAPHGERATDSDCRAFLIDTPWSAAFVSWVMRDAGLTTFTRSARHMDYIARAYRTPPTGPYRFADPAQEKAAPGDLLCHLRGAGPVRGGSGLRAALDGQSPAAWQSHCDIVVAANPGGDRLLYLIGGNVLNAVTMRKLPLDRSGRLQPEVFALPGATTGYPDGSGMEDPDTTECRPGNAAGCSFNRRDWAALLKLQDIPPSTPEPTTSAEHAAPASAPATLEPTTLPAPVPTASDVPGSIRPR